jgi:hypothetical protein
MYPILVLRVIRDEGNLFNVAIFYKLTITHTFFLNFGILDFKNPFLKNIFSKTYG